MKNDWNESSNGISYERACELEGHEYPRIAAAFFHFGELTPVERERTIESYRDNLRQAKARAKRLLAEASAGYSQIRAEQSQGKFYGGQDSMMKPHYNQMRKDARRGVDIAQRSLDYLLKQVTQ
jgi:hypothetical protein